MRRMPPLATPAAFPRREEGNGHVDRLIEPHLDEVDVLEASLHRMKREVANHREELFAVEGQLEDGVLPKLAAEHCRDFLRWDGDGRRREPLSVRDGGNEPALAQAARLALAGGDAGLGLKNGRACCGHGDSDHLSARPSPGRASEHRGLRWRGCL